MKNFLDPFGLMDGDAVDAYTKKEMDEILGPVDEALDEMIEALLIFVGATE